MEIYLKISLYPYFLFSGFQWRFYLTHWFYSYRSFIYVQRL